jgi:hypothetical protein
VPAEVLEHDRGPAQRGGGGHDRGGVGTLEAEPGERLVHLTRKLHLLQLLGDDAAVHLLGHLDEPHPLVERDDGERVPGRGAHGLVGHPGEPLAQLHDERGRPGAGQLLDVRRRLLVRPLHGEAGGEDHLAAPEEAGDLAHLADVDPAHRRVEPVCPGEHLRVAAAEGLRGEHGAEGRLHTSRVTHRHLAAFNGDGVALACRAAPGAGWAP